jgi:hypothetical protein
MYHNTGHVQGRKHVSHSFPDGTTRYTIDGVDQSGHQRGEPAGFIPPPPPPYPGIEDAPSPSRSSRHGSHTLPSPPPGSFGARKLSATQNSSTDADNITQWFFQLFQIQTLGQIAVRRRGGVGGEAVNRPS